MDGQVSQALCMQHDGMTTTTTNDEGETGNGPVR